MRRLPTQLYEKAVRFTTSFQPQGDVEKRNKKVLELYFLKQMSATGIAKMKDPTLVSTSNRSKGKCLSASSILEIVYTYFPEIRNMPPVHKPKHQDERVQLMKKRRRNQSGHLKKCAFCGTEKNLEEHHMIPLCLGGTNDDENLVWLCKGCHRDVSDYQMRLTKKG